MQLAPHMSSSLRASLIDTSPCARLEVEGKPLNYNLIHSYSREGSEEVEFSPVELLQFVSIGHNLLSM